MWKSKVCPKCGEDKPASEYYSNYGYCKPCHKEYGKNPDKQRHYQLRKKFGIGINDYNRMFEDQKGCCAICGDHQSESNRALAVDHDHDTGYVRALLCMKCNTALGKFKDSIEVLQKALAYLEKYK